MRQGPALPQSTPTVQEGDGRLTVTGDDYVLELGSLALAPYATLSDRAGERWMSLALIASVDSEERADETVEVGPPAVEPTSAERPDAITIVVPQTSTGWTRKTVRLVCTPRTVELSVSVDGTGSITDVTLLGGVAILANGACGAFRTSIEVQSLLVPAPTEPVQFVRPATSGAVLGMLGDADPGRLHGIFSPPPLVLGLGRAAPDGGTEPPTGPWLGMSIREDVRRLTCVAIAYEPIDGGFLLRAGYEGHTRVDGPWTSPVVVLRSSPSAWQVVDDHRADLVAHGFAPDAEQEAPAWWSEPLFCGWGAQRALARVLTPDDPASGPELARQDRYDEWLTALAKHGVVPGTVVIDDRWQADYGTAQPDIDRWPDLAGWIRERHAAGQRVLLWWKAWDPSGLPVDECIVDPIGRPVAADPANSAYLDHLRRIVRTLLAPDGLDADGFKVDFTQRGPSGRSLRSAPGVWGIAGLHALLRNLRAAAKEAKPDALVVTHAIHPSFGDVSDMVRMNDVLERDASGRTVPVVEQLRIRVGIAHRALPHHLVDTDQWRMPDRAEWLQYVDEQAHLGVPALYYVDRIDTSGEEIPPEDLRRVATTWNAYRETRDAHR